MKKILTTIISFIIFLILYFLQINFFSWFNISGIKPNLFVLLVLCIGLFAGRSMGSISGMIFGFLLDIFIGKNIGPTGIILGIIGFAGGYLDKNFSKNSKLTIIIMCMASTAVYEILQYFINIIGSGITIEIILFIKILLIELIFNAILTIILYPIIQKVGFYIEGEFKEKNILTRYF